MQQRNALVSRKGRVSLFEVMSSAPQVQYPKRRKGLFGRKQSEQDASAIPTVAEALTEEEARAEMEAQRRAEQEKRLAAEEKRRAREEKKAAKRAQKAAKRAAAIEAAQNAPKVEGDSPVRVSQGRVVFSLGSVAGVTAAAAVCLLLLGAYALGRKSMSGDGGQGLRPAAAIKTPADGNSSAASRQGRRAERPTADRSGEQAKSAELIQLLSKPPAKQESGGVVANVPASVAGQGAAAQADAEDLNYLQIESFLIQRERSGDVVAQDLADVRRFLAERGIATQARRHSNGFVLYSAKGFKTGAECREEREAFRSRVEELGAEYRKSGGLYEFKGCDFVNYGKTQTGRPV